MNKTTEAKDKTDRREIKFRAWDSYHKDMITPWCELKETGHFWGEDTTNKPIYVESAAHVMQFTGFKDKNGRDVYEGDIFRIEENDEENTVIYVVVVWVKEWAMFTTLRLEDEYPAYLLEGADAIDETMFWTYTLEDIGSPKHYPCGNIYENPELLQP